MEIARSWNIPPYKLLRESKTLWWAREIAMRDVRIKKIHHDETKLRAARGK